jgi:hypothetical protein
MDDEFEEYQRQMAEIGKPFYRFSNGTFVEAKDFDEAKRTMIARIEAEVEDADGWHSCTCVGLSHRHRCPVQKAYGIPF